MGFLTFKGGIHPIQNKQYTENKPIEEVLPKGDLVFPMLQHIGAPCNPIVKKGQRVLVGEKIGEAVGVVSSPIHSSVSGTVKNIMNMYHPNGFKVMSVIIENDNLYEKIPYIKTRLDYMDLPREEVIKIIKEAGIVGMGGAGFPTHIKLSPSSDDKIDSIIINGSECEPYLTCDHRLMLENTKEIIEGLKIVLKLFPEAKAYICIENNKNNAIRAMEDASKDVENIEVVALKTKFPQGAEKQLIYSVTKREVHSGKLPATVGCIVQNVDTIYEIYNAVVNGSPLISIVVTVTGDAIKEPKNFRAKIGTSYRELIDAAGGFVEEPLKVISGGPMMGIAAHTLDIPVIKGSSGILCLTKAEASLPEESNCINCGRCVEFCPMHLMPVKLAANATLDKYKIFDEYHGLDCIECGSCSYICPASRHLVQKIRTGKKIALQYKKKK